VILLISLALGRIFKYRCNISNHMIIYQFILGILGRSMERKVFDDGWAVIKDNMVNGDIIIWVL